MFYTKISSDAVIFTLINMTFLEKGFSMHFPRIIIKYTETFFNNLFTKPIRVRSLFTSMMSSVFRLMHYLKISKIVVEFISVFMVYYLIFIKFSTKMLFHNITMLKNSFSIYIYSTVSRFSYTWFIPYTFISTVSFKSLVTVHTNTLFRKIIPTNFLTFGADLVFYFTTWVKITTHNLTLTNGDNYVKF